MAGHNKWSKIKRSKGVLDSKRGKIFSKLSKEITVAAKLGGGDPDGNARLRSAILTAKAENMPTDNIDRAIKRGSGELQTDAIEEIVYEGYAPGGVALIIEVATDNRNRAAADLRNIFTKNNGSLASSGSVSYMFHRKGRITLARAAADGDALFEAVLEAGADELFVEDDSHIVVTPPNLLYQVADALKRAGFEADSARLTFIPETSVVVSDPLVASQVLRLCDALEDNDDVQAVHSNIDIPEHLHAQLGQE